MKARATVYSQTVKATGKDCYHQAIYLSRVLLFSVLKHIYDRFLMFIQDVSQGHIKTCASCKKSHDQHLLAHCDTCKLHYHLGCLTPPLTRMPKKSGHYGWSCSECYPDSSDSNPNVGDVYDDDIEGGVDAATQKRNRKRRLAASKGSCKPISYYFCSIFIIYYN